MANLKNKTFVPKIIDLSIRLIYKTIKHVYWKYIIPLRWLCIRKPHEYNIINSRYSIGLVTYIDRYDKFFKKLITRLAVLFPDTQITVALNGYYDRDKQLKYLDEVKIFVSELSNVKLLPYVEPQSLCKLWNQCILHSPTNKVFIFNDDITIAPSFRKILEYTGIMEEKAALINRSWSHYLISREIIKEVGWFDERFPGVGNEDWDYEARMVVNGHLIRSFRHHGLKNIVFHTKDFSYGKDTKVVHKKYVGANMAFFKSKWELSEESKDGFVWVSILGAYAKLKEGMDTPNFYP